MGEVMQSAEVQVQFPSGTVRPVNMLRLLVQAQNAEFKAKHGMFLPGVGKQHPSVRALREEYELPAEVRTWEVAGRCLRRFHADLSAVIAERRSCAPPLSDRTG
jgi:hypothetical protein